MTVVYSGFISCSLVMSLCCIKLYFANTCDAVSMGDSRLVGWSNLNELVEVWPCSALSRHRREENTAKRSLSFDVREEVSDENCDVRLLCLGSNFIGAWCHGEREAFKRSDDVNDDLFDDNRLKLPSPLRRKWELQQDAFVRDNLIDDDIFHLILFAWAPLCPLFQRRVPACRCDRVHQCCANHFEISFTKSHGAPDRVL